MGVETALLIAAVAGAAGTAVNYHQGEKARQEADSQRGKQAAQQAEMEGQAKDRMAREESDAATAAARDQAKQRLRMRMAGLAGNKGGTLLTGPAGLAQAPGAGATPAAGGTNTLLGQ